MSCPRQRTSWCAPTARSSRWSPIHGHCSTAGARSSPGELSSGMLAGSSFSPCQHAGQIESRQDADRMLPLSIIDHHYMADGVPDHQPCRIAQRHRRLDGDRRLPRGVARALSTRIDAGAHQVLVGREPPDVGVSRRRLRGMHHHDAVDVVGGHDPRHVGERRLRARTTRFPGALRHPPSRARGMASGSCRGRAESRYGTWLASFCDASSDATRDDHQRTPGGAQ